MRRSEGFSWKPREAETFGAWIKAMVVRCFVLDFLLGRFSRRVFGCHFFGKCGKMEDSSNIILILEMTLVHSSVEVVTL